MVFNIAAYFRWLTTNRIFNSLDKKVEFFGDLDMPNFHDKTEFGNLIINLNSLNHYTKYQVDTLIYNINLVDYYTKAEIATLLYTNYTSLSFTANICLSKN